MHELFLIAHQGPDIDLRIPGDTSVQHGLPGTLHGPGDLPRQHPVVERRLQGGLDFHEPCHVTGRDAVRRQRGRPVAQRDQHLPDAYLGRVTERVHGPCTTVGVQDEVARVEAAFQGLLVDQGRGVQVVDVDQAGRGLLRPQAQGVGQPPDHGPGRGLVQRHASGLLVLWVSERPQEHHGHAVEPVLLNKFRKSLGGPALVQGHHDVPGGIDTLVQLQDRAWNDERSGHTGTSTLRCWMPCG